MPTQNQPDAMELMYSILGNRGRGRSAPARTGEPPARSLWGQMRNNRRRIAQEGAARQQQNVDIAGVMQALSKQYPGIPVNELEKMIRAIYPTGGDSPIAGVLGGHGAALTAKNDAEANRRAFEIEQEEKKQGIRNRERDLTDIGDITSRLSTAKTPGHASAITLDPRMEFFTEAQQAGIRDQAGGIGEALVSEQERKRRATIATEGRDVERAIAKEGRGLETSKALIDYRAESAASKPAKPVDSRVLTNDVLRATARYMREGFLSGEAQEMASAAYGPAARGEGPERVLAVQDSLAQVAKERGDPALKEFMDVVRTKLRENGGDFARTAQVIREENANSTHVRDMYLTLLNRLQEEENELETP